MQNILIWISNVLVLGSYLTYIWMTIKGKVKPHRTTRFVLLLIISVGFMSLYAQGDRVVVWFLGICWFGSLAEFFLSLKYGMGGWDPIDILCLIIAILGIILWKITSNPALALYATVLADMAGMIPSLIKTYRFPDTEYWLSYLLDILAVAFTIMAIQNGGFNEYIYPAYLLVVNTIMQIFMFRKELFKSSST